MANRIQLRRDTAANWTRENPILSQGEPGFDLTANKLKVGDGVTAWANLAYASGSGDVSTATSWTATPASGNCPIYVELTPDHFEAYTQNSHLALRNDYTWSLGSNNNGNGIFSNDNTATIYSNYGQVVIRTGESFQHFTFTDAGRLQFPNGNIFESVAGTNGANIQIVDNTGTFKIYTHATTSALAWTFGPTGLLSTPGGIFIPSGDNEAGLSFSPNGSSTVGRISVDTGNNMTVNATHDYSVKVSSYDRLYISTNVTTLMAGQDLVLKSNKNATEQVWTFSANGNLTLPTGGQIKTAANTGTVVINTNNGATTSTWTFGADGNLTLPTSGLIKNSDGSTYGGGAGDFVITATTISAAAGSVALSGYGVSNIAWNSGDNTYVVTYPSNPGYGYHTKVIFASTNVSQLDGNAFYLNPYNYPTNTQWGIYSDYDCTIKVNGSAFDAWSSGGATNELIPGSKILIKTGTPANNTDPGEIEFHIGGKTYGWRIDKDNHLRLPADGGASKIKNYYGKNAVFQGDNITFSDSTTQSTAYQVVKSAFNASSPSVQMDNVQFSYNNSGNPTVAAVSGTWASSYTVEYQLWDGSAYTTYTTGNPSATWSSIAAYGIGVNFAHAGDKAVAHFTDNTNSHIYRVTWLASSTNPTTNCTIIVEKLI